MNYTTPIFFCGAGFVYLLGCGLSTAQVNGNHPFSWWHPAMALAITLAATGVRLLIAHDQHVDAERERKRLGLTAEEEEFLKELRKR